MISTTKPLAAIYIRVSTEEQAKQGVSLAAQQEALENYVKALGYELYKLYKDEGKSAKDIKHRPAMVSLLRMQKSESSRQYLFTNWIGFPEV